MSFLIFGSSGQVGRELAKLQNLISENLIFLNRLDANLYNPSDCRDIIIDHKPLAVINAAAWTGVDDAENSEEKVFIVNSQAPASMASACKALSIPFLHISSDYVFDGKGKIPWKPDDSPNPVNIYGKSKLLGEKLITAQNANFFILRTSWVFSEHGSNFVKTMLDLGKKNDSIQVVSDQFGGPTSAKSIASSILAIIDSMLAGSKGGIFHFTGSPDVSWAEFAKTIMHLAELSCEILPIQSKAFRTLATRPLNSRLDNTSLYNEFRIKRPNWIEDLKEVILQIKG